MLSKVKYHFLYLALYLYFFYTQPFVLDKLLIPSVSRDIVLQIGHNSFLRGVLIHQVRKNIYKFTVFDLDSTYSTSKNSMNLDSKVVATSEKLVLIHRNLKDFLRK